jgi:glycosyltransferase involved in cell wall biosynthesis
LKVALLYTDTGSPTDAIRAHTEHLASALGSASEIEVDVWMLGHDGDWRSTRDGGFGLGDADWAIVQYNPFSYGRWGFAPHLLRAAGRLASAQGPQLGVLVHEPFVPIQGIRSAVMGSWQRLQLWQLLRTAQLILVTCEAWRARIPARAPVVHLPVGSMLPGPAQPQHSDGRDSEHLTVATFRTGHPSHLAEHTAAALDALDAEGHRVRFCNLGAGAPVPANLPPGIVIESPGRLPEREISSRLAGADIFLAPLVDGLSTRRTTVMAALQHGLPIIATEGPSTDAVLRDARDAITLVQSDDLRAWIDASVALARDSERRAAQGRAARRLYEREFAWPVIADKLLAACR